MIYCVSFADVEDHLGHLQFEYVETSDGVRLYARSTTDFTIREPNINGDLPEVIVSDAFHRAGLPMPAWSVHWCD